MRGRSKKNEFAVNSNRRGCLSVQMQCHAICDATHNPAQSSRQPPKNDTRKLTGKKNQKKSGNNKCDDLSLRCLVSLLFFTRRFLGILFCCSPLNHAIHHLRFSFMHACSASFVVPCLRHLQPPILTTSPKPRTRPVHARVPLSRALRLHPSVFCSLHCIAFSSFLQSAAISRLISNLETHIDLSPRLSYYCY